jgi:hypothetical protein
MTGGRRALVLGALLAVSLGGCASMREVSARSTGRLLAQAGFREEPAETSSYADPDAAKPLQLVARWRGDQLVYTYADPYACHCIYVGGPAEHAAYEQLAAERRRARGDRDPATEWEGWNTWWWRGDGR